MHKIKWYHLVILGIIFTFFIVFILPYESNQSLSYGIDKSPDTSIFYTGETLYDLAESYGEDGRAFYVKQRFTFDLFWPIAYGLFLTAITGYLCATFRDKRLKFLIFIPIFSVIFDYLENMMASIVIYRYPNPTFLLPYLSGYMTLIKWSLIVISIFSICILSLFILYQKYFNKRKQVNLWKHMIKS